MTVAKNGDMSGYAWSSNIGWISFEDGDTKKCPENPCKPKFDSKTGKVTGWARALVAKDGWDGWIHLAPSQGTSYGVTVAGCDWSGYAWGSDVVGWIHFSGSNYGVLGEDDACVEQPVEIEVIGVDQDQIIVNEQGVTEVHITAGETFTLDWSAPNGSECTGVGGYGGWTSIEGDSGQFTASPPEGNYTYTLECTDPDSQTFEDSLIAIVTESVCSDGIDNEDSGDGKVDAFGIDLNGDGKFDQEGEYPPDPSCNGDPNGTSESSAGIYFTASRTSVYPGQSSTLSWSTQGYGKCELNDDDSATNDRTVYSTFDSGDDLNGTKVVTPPTSRSDGKKQTMYTITCDPGRVTKNVNITVGKTPKFKEITPQ